MEDGRGRRPMGVLEMPGTFRITRQERMVRGGIIGLNVGMVLFHTTMLMLVGGCLSLVAMLVHLGLAGVVALRPSTWRDVGGR